jgi:hypothetical protein
MPQKDEFTLLTRCGQISLKHKCGLMIAKTPPVTDKPIAEGQKAF